MDMEEESDEEQDEAQRDAAEVALLAAHAALKFEGDDLFQIYIVREPLTWRRTADPRG
jgi:hypothetical protein